MTRQLGAQLSVFPVGMGAMGMSFVPPLNPSDIAVGERVRFTFFSNADGAFEIEEIASVDAMEDAP